MTEEQQAPHSNHKPKRALTSKFLGDASHGVRELSPRVPPAQRVALSGNSLPGKAAVIMAASRKSEAFRVKIVREHDVVLLVNDRASAYVGCWGRTARCRSRRRLWR